MSGGGANGIPTGDVGTNHPAFYPHKAEPAPTAPSGASAASANPPPPQAMSSAPPVAPVRPTDLPIHACELLGGRVECWQDTSAAPIPVDLADAPSQLSSSSLNGCAIVHGALWCWNTQVDTDFENGHEVLAPYLVPGLESGVSFVDVEYATTCAVQNAKSVCWDNVAGMPGGS